MQERFETACRKPPGWMDTFVGEPPTGKQQIAQQNFLPDDLAILKRLTTLPDEMRDSIVAVIDAAHAMLGTHPKSKRKRHEPVTT
jgi:hypothetical protein